MSRRLCLLIAALVGAVLLSLMAGARWLDPLTVGQALWAPSPTDVDALLVRTTRLSRTLVALAVGAALGVAGGIMQTLTRNPLASPGLLGINAGALFAVVVLVILGGALPGWLANVGAFAGAALASLLVGWIAMRRPGESSPLRLILAGAALTALFQAFSQALLVIDQQGLDAVLFWLAGSVSGRPLADVWPLMLLALAALLACGPCLRPWNVLAAGEAVAIGAGVAVRRLQLVSIVLVVALAGSAVTMAGNIAFVGLIVPHVARRVSTPDHRHWLPVAALLGAILLLLADVAARTLILPGEVPIGVMTALVGAPVFMALVRRQGAAHG
ncbi:MULTISPECIES: iron ABC transporter permease [unclassified Modicisalibacter]|uniref:FecCD family ABC transporter permease n=1 Tax=unclassified Modicisalibacter TaxID=2679913 RepID=UPI001CCD04E1|nr:MULTISPECIES: iron ABC transporter permease [unclassified Modicisalibacter]MBZ9558627.1 iron ABC transporter permease [Modicisalibacter sp. R2A 31.J]MBZ9575481.1 iron ABC transporter permease [Modicisalibacter sp. MOD 31.J]